MERSWNISVCIYIYIYIYISFKTIANPLEMFTDSFSIISFLPSNQFCGYGMTIKQILYDNSITEIHGTPWLMGSLFILTNELFLCISVLLILYIVLLLFRVVLMLNLNLYRENFARTLGGSRARKQVILYTYRSAGGSSHVVITP